MTSSNTSTACLPPMASANSATEQKKTGSRSIGARPARPSFTTCVSILKALFTHRLTPAVVNAVPEQRQEETQVRVLRLAAPTGDARVQTAPAPPPLPPSPEDDHLQHLVLAPPYDAASYTRLPPDHLVHPFRIPFLLIARLFLIHATTPSPSSTPSDIQRLEDLFSAYEGPDTCWARRAQGHRHPRDAQSGGVRDARTAVGRV
ncbi:hypothetical protein EUX98_g9087 [Antrodiella citrinella]|uniref:Uncharacterized protein n=1 Tax=Antrodiella citrinella TaxID=2447956 RepID=A0A4S4LYJ5_9APHY|nr:hypothetical protein EUX98_g9087 [Antrodiella citrinella]